MATTVSRAPVSGLRPSRESSLSCVSFTRFLNALNAFFSSSSVAGMAAIVPVGAPTRHGVGTSEMPLAAGQRPCAVFGPFARQRPRRGVALRLERAIELDARARVERRLDLPALL